MTSKRRERYINSGFKLIDGMGIDDFGGGPFAQTRSIMGAGGQDYAIYDSSSLNRMWQESTGPTPANANSPIGLIIGREKQDGKTFSQVMDGRPELYLGPYEVGGPGTAVESPAGTLSVTGDGSATLTYGAKSFATVPGKSYRIIGSVSGAAISVRAGIAVVSTANLTVVQTNRSFDLFFVATAAMTFVTFCKSSVGMSVVTGVGVKEIPAHYASQATLADRPTLTAGQLDFSLSTTANLLTDWFAQSGSNSLIVQMQAPSSVATTQTILGTEDSGANRLSLALETSGKLAYRVGNTSYTVIAGSPDIRSQMVVAGISVDGASAKLFVETALVADNVQSGFASTTIPFRFGANNSNGSPLQYFGGQIKRLAFGKPALTLAQFQAIRNEWIATP